MLIYSQNRNRELIFSDITKIANDFFENKNLTIEKYFNFNFEIKIY